MSEQLLSDLLSAAAIFLAGVLVGVWLCFKAFTAFLRKIRRQVKEGEVVTWESGCGHVSMEVAREWTELRYRTPRPAPPPA